MFIIINEPILQHGERKKGAVFIEPGRYNVLKILHGNRYMIQYSPLRLAIVSGENCLLVEEGVA